MLLRNRGNLAAALRLMKISVPETVNVDGALLDTLEEEAHAEFPDLDNDAIDFIARIRALRQAEVDIADRAAALEADRQEKAKLEEQIRNAN